MKVWQKIYLVMLAVSMVFVNVGIYAVFQLTYQKNLETEQLRGETDYGVIRKNIQKTMQTMESQGRLSGEAAADLMKIYEEDYAKQKIQIKLWKNGNQIYPEGEEEIPYTIEENQTRIMIRGDRRHKELAAFSELTGFSESYSLYMEYPLEKLNDTWNQLYRIYLFISFGISLVLALVLSVMLRFLLRPLQQLTGSVSRIQKGDYASRVQIRGKDELASLGNHINAMAETIEENMEALREDNRRQEQLVDNLAHEMKSPLTSIYGFAEYLMKGRVEPEEIAECCSFIMEESLRMKDMCYALMDLSEIRHKKIEMTAFPAKQFMEETEQTAVRWQSGIGEEKKVRVNWSNALSAEEEIYGNKMLLEMLLLNLVSNAVRACQRREISGPDASGEKVPEVSVFMERIDEEQNKEGILLRITDEGMGIPEDKLPHITEPFFRADKGRSREEGGNGLGLALCAQIVKCHGGTMEFSSVPGQGTTVRINLYKKG
ncbi:MAG: HAMP domain-containing histidine kinase [Lachnospiraceae bacterium]|nr:HAMP domain-containing histidine kinase [Lachnospiraceae bacterium]